MLTDGGDDASLEDVLRSKVGADDLILAGVGGATNEVPHVSRDHGQGEDQAPEGPNQGVAKVLGKAGGQELQHGGTKEQHGDRNHKLGVLGSLHQGNLKEAKGVLFLRQQKGEIEEENSRSPYGGVDDGLDVLEDILGRFSTPLEIVFVEL